MTEVLKVDRDAIEPPPDIVVAGLESQYLQGVCDIGDRLLILLDFNRILRVEEIRRLRNVIPGGSAADSEAFTAVSH